MFVIRIKAIYLGFEGGARENSKKGICFRVLFWHLNLKRNPKYFFLLKWLR